MFNVTVVGRTPAMDLVNGDVLAMSTCVPCLGCAILPVFNLSAAYVSFRFQPAVSEIGETRVVGGKKKSDLRTVVYGSIGVVTSAALLVCAVTKPQQMNQTH